MTIADLRQIGNSEICVNGLNSQAADGEGTLSILLLRSTFLAWFLVAASSLPICAGPRSDVFTPVASINLCTDQLLLAIADRERIIGVSMLATDSRISFLASKARGLPSIRGNAEELLNIKAKLVLAGAYDRRLTRRILRRRNIDFLTINTWQTLADGYRQIRFAASRLGYPERGERIITAIGESLQGLLSMARSRKTQTTFAVIQRRGYVLRSGVVVELLEAAGLRNVSRRLSTGASGVASLEEIVRSRPDLLVVEQTADHTEDQGTAKLAHPALIRLYPPGRRLVIPPRLAICAGPSTVHLIRYIGRALRNLTL